jgi:hypothetical protein
MQAPATVLLSLAFAAAGGVHALQGAGQAAPPQVSAQPVLDEPGTLRRLPAGTEVDLLLQTPINFATAQLDERFEATAIACVIDAGSLRQLTLATAKGFIGSVRHPGPGRSTVTLSFEELHGVGKVQKLRATVSQVFAGRTPERTERENVAPSVTTERIPLVGVVVGMGGAIALLSTKDVVLPAGVIVRVRLDQPVDVRLRQ